MKTTAIIEARMGSTRLPGKTLMDIAGATLLERVIERIQLAVSVNQVVVATSINEDDNCIEQLCLSIKIPCFRGSEDDVLGRVYNAAKMSNTDIIVQSGADCPFYDPEIIDLLVNILKLGGYSYVANDMKLTFPEGIDAHVMTIASLEAAAMEATSAHEREDTPRFIWNHPDRFSIFNFEAIPGTYYNRPQIRLTVDYPEDLELARIIYKELYSKCHSFSTMQLIKFLDERPGYLEINVHCKQMSAAYL